MNLGTTYLVFLTGFVLAGAFAWLATPLVGSFARRFNVLDKPDFRKLHGSPVPRLGGIAIFIGIVLTFLILAIFLGPGRDLILPHIRKFLYLSAGCILMFGIGIVDDVRGVRPRTKLLFQIAAASIAFYGGFQFPVFRDISEGGIVWLLISLALTIVWTIGTTNAVNLIDGLDGLASGITAIALITLGIISARNNHLPIALTAFIGAGAAIGFLGHNRHPASIFMGDSGSLLLGFLLSVLTIQGSRQGSILATLVGPLCLLYVPLLDTVLAIIRRSMKGLPFTFPDKHHIHHRLLSRGIKHPRVVTILWGVTLAVASFGIAIHYLQEKYQAVFTNIFAVALLLFTVRHFAQLEVHDSIKSVSKINRRKLTPREKVLAIRRDLEIAAQKATANSLLEDLIHIAEKLEIDALHITMELDKHPESAISIIQWNHQPKNQYSQSQWKPEAFPLVTESASARYVFQNDVLLTVQISRSGWKNRRKSEDAPLWARIMVEKLVTLKQLQMFCPWEMETLQTLNESI